MSDINCPYCDAELEVCHDDGQGYAEGVKHQMQCAECEKYFVFGTSITFYYDPMQADCLNDEKHQWSAQHCSPTKFTKMECETCGEIREPSEEEMSQILNGKENNHG